jgi:hypothetical protein
MGGYVLAGVPGRPAELAIRGTSQPLAWRQRRKVSLVTSITARVLAYWGETAGVLTRSGSLRFAPSATATPLIGLPNVYHM